MWAGVIPTFSAFVFGKAFFKIICGACVKTIVDTKKNINKPHKFIVPGVGVEPTVAGLWIRSFNH